jgi:hypothetical protein
MKKIFYSGLFCFFAMASLAQTTDTTVSGMVTIIKDSRLNELAKKELAFNEALAIAVKTAKGYRLKLLSTNDRSLAMKVRTQLLQRFPEQKVYMSFQPPYIQLKFGNFLDKEEAESYRNEIIRYKLVASNIYLVPETIEIKPDKNKDKENSNN